MTTMLETQDAPPVDGAKDEVEEVALPAGRSLEDFFGDEDESSSEAGDAKPAEKEPAKPTAAAPVAAPAEKKDPEPTLKPEKKGDVRVALKKEREEKKALKQRLEKATSPNIWERIEAQRQEARLKHPQGRQRAAAPEMKNADLQAARAEAVTASEKAGSFDTADGAVVEVALSHATKMFKTWQKDFIEHFDYQRQLDQETELREDLADEGEDYDEIMTKSGLLPMIQTDKAGQPLNPAAFDPEVVRLVYGSVNPPKKALKLARQRLKYLESKSAPSAQTEPDDDDDSSTTSIVPGHEKPAKVAAPADPAEARREGARQAIERVNEHATQPRGLRAFTRAGAPNAVQLNDALRARLDRMANERPEAFDEFCRLNPKLADWWENEA